MASAEFRGKTIAHGGVQGRAHGEQVRGELKCFSLSYVHRKGQNKCAVYLVFLKCSVTRKLFS